MPAKDQRRSEARARQERRSDQEGVKGARPTARPGQDLRLSDLSIEGMIHATTIRSPQARGVLRSVNFPVLPAGYRGILASDIPGANAILAHKAQIPLLAEGRVEYKGEPVALIAGPDPYVLEELAAAVSVLVTEEEPLLFSVDCPPEQRAASLCLRVGNAERAFAEAAVIREDFFENGALSHCCSEPEGALAAYDYDKMAIYCASQWPHHVRDSVAAALGCRADEVCVRSTLLGAHLDARLWYPSLVACHAALAARLCGRPVKMLFTRQEDFSHRPKRARGIVKIRSALDAEGNLSAMDIGIDVDVGAYTPLAEDILNQALAAASGVYDCPAIRIEGRALRSSSTPMDAFEGLGAAQSFFAVEAHANRIAADFGIDPLDWRARNIPPREASKAEALHKAGSSYSKIAQRLAARSDFRRKYACYELVRKRRSGSQQGPLRGIGMAYGFQDPEFPMAMPGANNYSVEVFLDKELKAQIKTSVTASRSLGDVWRRGASEVLGLPLSSITVMQPDTQALPSCGPATLSRGVRVVETLLRRACAAVQKRRFREALPLSARSSCRIPGPAGQGGAFPGQPHSERAAWAGAVLELELDPDSFEPRPLGLWLCIDGGEIISPKAAETALRSSAIAALGSCLYERLDCAPEADMSRQYFLYGLPPLALLPPITVDFLEPKKKDRAKGIGELAQSVVPAAFLSALSQAAGFPFSRLPMQIGRIIEAAESS